MSLLPFPPSFAKHDCARRKFRLRVYDPILDETVVEIVESWRVRFRCRECLKVFTEYPPFALPHKRFVKQDVLAKAVEYLSAEKTPKCRATYREAVEQSREKTISAIAFQLQRLSDCGGSTQQGRPATDH